jgi:hypothetical protein
MCISIIKKVIGQSEVVNIDTGSLVLMTLFFFSVYSKERTTKYVIRMGKRVGNA